MPRYWIESRVNATLSLLSEISDFEALTVRLRLNQLSTWQLQLRRESQYASDFLPDVNKALGNGLLLWFDPEDGVTQPVLLLSGPEHDYELSRKEDGTGLLLVNGYDDNFALQSRLALPVPGYPYDSVANIGARYYKLGEASGTTATDSSVGSGGPQAGTYTNSFTYGQPGLIDDPATCVKFNGTNGEVGVPTAGMNAGNNQFSVAIWGMLSANPSGNVYLWSHGTNANNQSAALWIDSSGIAHANVNGVGSVSSASAITPNVPFMLAMTWDGTTFTGYFNSVSMGTFTPAALNITYGFARIGDFLGASGFWPGWLGRCTFYNGNLGAVAYATPPIGASIPWTQMAYATGVDRQANSSYDGLVFPTTASTTLIFYVQRNASATASPIASYGSALPATTFTCAQGSTPRQARPVPNLVCASDPQLGSTVYAAARFDKLLILLAAIALQSNPELGFRVQQVNQQLVFSVFQPTDRTATAVFSLDLGNLRSYTWQYGRSQANYLFTGGLNASTSLTSRTFGEAGDATSIGQFGLIEDFYDYRKTQDTTTLANVMQAKLAELRARRNINAAINDTSNLYFGGPGNKGYNLGDKVRVILEDGNTYDDLVREVDITLAKGQPAKVTAAIGTPIDAQILSEWDLILKRFKDSGYQIDLVQQNY